jgi:hypothetical protein
LLGLKETEVKQRKKTSTTGSSWLVEGESGGFPELENVKEKVM